MNLSIFNFKNYYRLTIFCVLLVVFILFMVALFVWVINPHNIWKNSDFYGINLNKPNVFFMQQSIKPIALLNRNPETFVVGTSRAVFGYSDKNNEGLYYNGAMAGASMYSNKVLLDYAGKLSSFNRVILFVDFFSFNEYGRVGKDRARFYDVSAYPSNGFFLALKEVDLWGYYFFSVGLYDAIKTVKINLRGVYKGFFLQSDGSFNYSEDPTISLWKGVIKSLVTNIWFPQEKFCFYSKSNTSINYLALEGALSNIYEKDTLVDIVISPIHFYTLSALYEVGLSPSFYQWKKDLVNINEAIAKKHNKKPYVIWDFSTINEYSIAERDKAWFYDPSHMSKSFGEEISRVIREGDSEWQINTSNVVKKQKKDKLMFLEAKKVYKGDHIEMWLESYISKNKNNKHICDL